MCKQCECCNLLIWLLKLISAACVCKQFLFFCVCKNRAKFKNGAGTDLWYCCLKSEVGDVILSRVRGNNVEHDLGFCLFVTLDLQAQSILLVDWHSGNYMQINTAMFLHFCLIFVCELFRYLCSHLVSAPVLPAGREDLR